MLLLNKSCVYQQLKHINLMFSTRKFSLVKNQAYINGKWVSAQSGKMFNVLNPANGQTICQVPDMNQADAEVAIKSAYDAFQTWEFTTAKERSALLRNWFNLIQTHKDEIAEIMTAESGKPLAESAGEVAYGNGFVEWFSEQAKRIWGEVIESPTPTKEMLLIKRPIGVAGLITPWNFPVAMITRKAAAALAAGCTCVIKPAEDTPLSALALVQLAHDAGIPKGVINVVTCSRETTPEVGKLLCTSPLVAGISFTGSTSIGKLLYSQCADGVKRISLELGGNAPFIVFDSADIDKAVQGAMASKFRNCGQTCISANRIFVQRKVFDEFIEKLKEAMSRLMVGDGSKPNITLGPLINLTQAAKVKEMVEDAVNKGATVMMGGKAATDIGARYYEPTLLTNINTNMRVFHEEIFGPVAVCIEFDTEEEVIKVANGTRSGLASYFYSNNLAQIWRVAKRIECGMVGINESMISTPEAAFGGIKESGIGREGSHYGIDEYTYVKYLCFGGL